MVDSKNKFQTISTKVKSIKNINEVSFSFTNNNNIARFRIVIKVIKLKIRVGSRASKMTIKIAVN